MTSGTNDSPPITQPEGSAKTEPAPANQDFMEALQDLIAERASQLMTLQAVQDLAHDVIKAGLTGLFMTGQLPKDILDKLSTLVPEFHAEYKAGIGTGSNL